MIHLYGREQQARDRRCFPAIFQCTGTKSQPKRYTFGIFEPFGAIETGEQGKGCQRSARIGTRGNFVKENVFLVTSKLLRAFDRQCRSPNIPKPKGTKMSREGNKMRGLLRFWLHELRFCWGLLTADFIAKGVLPWYNRGTNKQVRFISRRRVF